MQYYIVSKLKPIKQSCRFLFFNFWVNTLNKSFVVLFSYILGFVLFSWFAFYVFTSYTQVLLIKFLSIWFGVILLLYWVVSAVWCLYDKDDYGRNVSASDDFYNVSFTSLWLVEGFLLSLFLMYAKLFDFYDPFLESEEIENSFVNEDVDLGGLKLLLFCFVIGIICSLVIDFLLSFESINSFWLITSAVIFTLFLILSFLRLSIRFLEEFDIEEDGEDLFDEVDYIFEHEDFPEEGFDGGDYAEGYEVLQLFFGYWHYMLITLHICFLFYSLCASQGKQTHVYWFFSAVSQNITLILILDYLDWAEVFFTYEIVSADTIYPWFYITEENINFVTSLFTDFIQIIISIIDYVYNIVFDNYFIKTLPETEIKTNTIFKEIVLSELLSA